MCVERGVLDRKTEGGKGQKNDTKGLEFNEMEVQSPCPANSDLVARGASGVRAMFDTWCTERVVFLRAMYESFMHMDR